MIKVSFVMSRKPRIEHYSDPDLDEKKYIRQLKKFAPLKCL